jgi:hypothetical protein
MNMTGTGRLGRRAAATLVSATLLAATLTGFVASPAQAYPVTAFDSNDWSSAVTQSETDGTFTWYNRSVEVQGEICSSEWGGATVTFEFYQYNVRLDTQSRFVNGYCRSFHWTEGAPAGGITVILVYLTDASGTRSSVFQRPA